MGMDITSRTGITRRVCPMIFVLDTSYSMVGERIGAVNAAMEQTLAELRGMDDDNADVEIQVAVMEFNNEATWIGTPGLVPVNDFEWKDLDVDGGTYFGEAFDLLNQALSVKHGFMKKASGSLAPVVMFLTDGEALDQYQSKLQALHQNKWFQVAVRVAIGYGEDADIDLLTEITKSKETVLSASKTSELKRLIKFVTITSTMVNSNTANQDTSGEADAAVANDDNTSKVGAVFADEADAYMSGDDDFDDDDEW